MKNFLEVARRRKGEKGATVIEYVLIVALVSIAIALALKQFTTSVNNAVTKVNTEIAKT